MMDGGPGIRPHRKFVPCTPRQPRSQSGGAASTAFSLRLALGPPQGLGSCPFPLGPWGPRITAPSHPSLSASPVPAGSPGWQAGRFWLEPARTASQAPAPALRHCAAARIAFPLPGFNHVASPLGRPVWVPVALYVKSQFLTVSGKIFPPAPHLACPASGPALQTHPLKTWAQNM